MVSLWGSAIVQRSDGMDKNGILNKYEDIKKKVLGKIMNIGNSLRMSETEEGSTLRQGRIMNKASADVFKKKEEREKEEEKNKVLKWKCDVERKEEKTRESRETWENVDRDKLNRSDIIGSRIVYRDSDDEEEEMKKSEDIQRWRNVELEKERRKT